MRALRIDSVLWDIVVACVASYVFMQLPEIATWVTGHYFYSEAVGLLGWLLAAPIAIAAFGAWRHGMGDDYMMAMLVAAVALMVIGTTLIGVTYVQDVIYHRADHFSCGYGHCAWNPATHGFWGELMGTGLATILFPVVSLALSIVVVGVANGIRLLRPAR